MNAGMQKADTHSVAFGGILERPFSRVVVDEFGSSFFSPWPFFLTFLLQGSEEEEEAGFITLGFTRQKEPGRPLHGPLRSRCSLVDAVGFHFRS